MSLIQKHAEGFLRSYLNDGGKYEEFINTVRSKIYEYRKTPHRVEFIQYMIPKIKVEYDEHLKVCKSKERGKCFRNHYYESVLFFLQEEIEDLQSQLQPEDFTIQEKEISNKTLERIYDDLQLLKLGQEITYDDFKQDFDELKEFYFLHQKNWKEMFIGRIMGYVASGIISETVCKKIVQVVEENYPRLINTQV